MITPEKIVAQARTWLGTRFRYQGRIKKNENNRGGVDCLGFIFGLCDELGYEYKGRPLSYYDTVVYSKKPDYNILRKKFSQFFRMKSANSIGVGDIVLRQISSDQCHLMVYTGDTFIHASATAFSVVEHGVDGTENCAVYSML